MIKHILVPIDFSKCSLNALKYASNLARKLGNADLLVMHAFAGAVAYSEAGYPAMSGITTQMKDEIEESFRELKKDVPELKEVTYSTRAYQGFAIDAILSLSAVHDIDLVVMGTKGTSGINEILIGTNTNSVIKNTKCPVLVVPEEANYRAIRNIALASDFKPIEGELLEPLKQIIKVTGSALHIIHIGDKEGIEPLEAQEAKKFEQYLKNIPHHFHYIVNDNVEEGLDDYMVEEKVDLLVLIPRKHRFFDMIFSKSESKKIIFHSKIPLLAIPD